MTIRLARLEDATMLTALFNSDSQVFGDNATGYEIADLLEFLSDSRKKIFICEEGGVLAGALMAEYHETFAHLETLIVLPAHQKKGIASALLDEFDRDLRQNNISLVEVLTSVDNVVMQAILERRGFRPGKKFIFYSKGE